MFKHPLVAAWRAFLELEDSFLQTAVENRG